MVNQSFSMKGFNLKELIKGNAEIIKIGLGALSAYAASGAMSPGYAYSLGLFVKIIADVCHYYISE